MAEKRAESLLGRVRRLETELECLRRDLLHRMVSVADAPVVSTGSLFGKLRGGDVTEAMIEEAKGSLFRDLRGM